MFHEIAPNHRNYITFYWFYCIFILVVTTGRILTNRIAKSCFQYSYPGYNLDEFIRIGQKLEDELRPLWEGDKPELSSFFFVASSTRVFMGFRSSEDHTVEGLMNKLRITLNKVPGMIAIVVRAGLFNQGFGGGRTIDLKLTGPELDKLMDNAKQAFFKVQGVIPELKLVNLV